MSTQTRNRLIGGGFVVLLAVAVAAVAVRDWPGGATGTAELSSGPAEAAEVRIPRPQARDGYLPRFTADGRLVRPEGWESWVLAGTSMGLTYTERPRAPEPGEPPGNFLNVYIQPWAYHEFMEVGEFPEGTMFILAASEPVSKADPARGGFYQGDLELMEVHLKRDGIDPTGWAFYGFTRDGRPAEKLTSDASCYSCHAEDADYDHVFVQFYPLFRERLGLDVATERVEGEG